PQRPTIASWSTLLGTALRCTARLPGRCWHGPDTWPTSAGSGRIGPRRAKSGSAFILQQEGDNSPERVRPQDRETLFEELSAAAQFPTVDLPRMVLDGYRHPPPSPKECTFARLTTCLSADLKTHVTPCQLGGRPVCAECG